jgi:coproporphyrinogen III oxidase-like Fe-S oxidoreductase
MKRLLPRIFRLLLSGKASPFVFEPQEVILPPKPQSFNLYIHLPFCRQICPFCPYVKESYDPKQSAAYQRALIKELEGYRQRWGEVKVDSVYFGGGTPSLTPEIVVDTLEWLKGNFRLGNEVGVEVHPRDASDSVLKSLKDSGVTMVSLGVQTFNDHLLKLLGRDYTAELAKEACQRALGMGFDTVDIDLIFALPGQSVDEVKADIGSALNLSADQISAYPLMFFAYMPFRRELERTKTALPGWRAERAMLNAITAMTSAAGYRRTSIWSFNKPQARRYTTVTNESFLGVGVGASTMMGDYFSLNTFSLPEYIKGAEKGSKPALATKLGERDKLAYWLFWRGYDLAIDTGRLKALFGRGLPSTIKGLLPLLRLLGLLKRQGDSIHLTDRGAYLFHLIEKEYTHAYLERLWGACFKEAWPKRVEI